MDAPVFYFLQNLQGGNMKLNLDAKTNEERKVKAYLEANAS